MGLQIGESAGWFTRPVRFEWMLSNGKTFRHGGDGDYSRPTQRSTSDRINHNEPIAAAPPSSQTAPVAAARQPYTTPMAPPPTMTRKSMTTSTSRRSSRRRNARRSGRARDLSDMAKHYSRLAHRSTSERRSHSKPNTAAPATRQIAPVAAVLQPYTNPMATPPTMTRKSMITTTSRRSSRRRNARRSAMERRRSGITRLSITMAWREAAQPAARPPPVEPNLPQV
jgi:hypothetical protein